MKNFLAVALLISLSTGFYFFFKTNNSPKKILLSSKNCDILAGPCTFNYQGQNFIRLEFAPSKVNNTTPFQVTMSLLENVSHVSRINNVQLNFQGIDMNLNAYFDLFSTNDKDYIVEAKLPYCTLKKMSWKLLLNFKALLKNNSVKQFFVVHDFTVIN